MPPIVLFGIQFTFSLAVYALIAWWYVSPRLSRIPRELALVPLVWVHVFRIVGGTILAPGAVDASVPADFCKMHQHRLAAWRCVVRVRPATPSPLRTLRNPGGG